MQVTGNHTEASIHALEDCFLPARAAGHDHIIWESARGARVRDINGRELIDFTSGVLVTNTGHAHPRVVNAIRDQAGRLLNCYDAPHPTRGIVARRLVEAAGSPFDAAALLTTGAEAIDAAVKAARAYTKRYEVVSFSEAFHGKTLGALSLSGMPGTRRGVGPVMPGSIVVPYPTCYRCPIERTYPECHIACFAVAEEMIRINSIGQIAAVIAEPYLGAGGAYVPPLEFWPRVQCFAQRNGALSILDEVQASFGRTGSFYAFQQLNIVPNLLVVAKGIASGFPMSAVISQKEILNALAPGVLGTTYGGNPLACAACLATLDVLEEEKLPARANRLGRHALDRMRAWIGSISGVGDVRGVGLSFGIDLVQSLESREPDGNRALEVLMAAGQAGVLVLPPAGSGGNVVRLAPPLVISEEDLDLGLERLEKALRQTVRRP